MSTSPLNSSSRVDVAWLESLFLGTSEDTWLDALLGAQDTSQQNNTPQSTPPANAEPATRALPSPIENPPYPMTDWTINNGFPLGENWDLAPSTLQHALFGKKLDNTPWRVTGWVDAGFVWSTSKDSNLPYTYNLVPNHPQLDQFVIEFSKAVNTVQKRYVDWGFLSAHLYGVDYRFTTAKGWLSDPFYKHNALYAYDPVLQWFEFYFPKIADGAVLQVGRYISPIDIEAQLSNSNYLYSHSLMFSYDPYTYTGINLQWRTTKQWTYCVGVHSGNENAFWSGVGNFNAELLMGWNSKDNKDSLWGGLDSVGDGKTRRFHDNEQIFSLVWGHKFSSRFHMQNQFYYMWQWDPVKGGTPSFGPVQPYGGGGGPGPVIKGRADATGFVQNLEYQLNKKDYVSFRTSILNDPTGWRTGFNNFYTDWTLGYSHLFTQNVWIRPEIRYERGYDNAAYDNGKRKDQYTASVDLILRF